MRVFVQADTVALKILRAALPDSVIGHIIGREVEVDENFQFHQDVNGTLATWALPPEAVKVVTE